MTTLFLLVISIFVLPSGNNIMDKAENSIIKKFPNAQLNILRISIPENIKAQAERKYRQKFYSKELNVFEIFKDDKIIARAIIDNVKGKTMPITFMVTYDLNGNIIYSEVIKYREPYGGQVKSQSWLDQFSQKNASSGFKVGKDIQSITGATISVNSISKAIGKLSFVYQKMY